MRKGAVILGIILVFGLIGGSVYFFFLGGRQQILPGREQGVPKDEQGTGATGDSVSRGVFTVSERRVLSPALSHDLETIWYFDDSGRLYKSSLDGALEEEFGLSEPEPITRALWPLAGNDFIVEQRADNKTSFRFFDTRFLAFTQLPESVEQVVWHPEGRRIIYVWRRGDGGRELKIADPDTSRYLKVTDLYKSYLLVPSVDGRFVFLYERAGASAQENKVYQVELDTGNFTVLLDRGVNTGVLPSPGGNKLLFSRLGSSGFPELWLYTFGPETFENLKIATSLDKVGWLSHSRGFVFAQPRSPQAGDWEFKNSTDDELFVYDIESKERKIQTLEGVGKTVDARDLVVHPDNQFLFFRNAQDGRLYRLNLK